MLVENRDLVRLGIYDRYAKDILRDRSIASWSARRSTPPSCPAPGLCSSWLATSPVCSASKTPTLSAAQEHFATGREHQKDDRVERVVKRSPGEAVGTAKDVGLKVVNAVGKVTSLASFVESLFGMGSASNASDQQYARGRSGGADIEQIWESIYESNQRGQFLSAEAIANLPPADLENIRCNGDAFINAKIDDMRIEKEQELAQSWAEYDHDRMGRER